MLKMAIDLTLPPNHTFAESFVKIQKKIIFFWGGGGQGGRGGRGGGGVGGRGQGGCE